MPYYVGDIPSEPIVLEPTRLDEPVDLTAFDQAEVALRDARGQIVDTLGFTATIDAEAGSLVIDWPGQSPFLTAGLYHLAIVLDGLEARERLAPVWLVAQEVDGWHNLDTARAEWSSAPDEDVWLFKLLALAREQVLAFAPAMTAGDWPPMSYQQAQLMQARNQWNASKVDPASGGLGEDGGFVMRPFPLDWMIRQILRPKTGTPAVG